jgi:hypothetical protein
MPKTNYVLNPNDTVSGETITQWTEDWWRWAWQAPASSNPASDPDGRFAHVNGNDGSGPVFFISGSPSQDAASVTERDITVPAGKAILFPLINVIDAEGPGIPASIPGLNPIATTNLVISDFMSHVNKDTLFANIDGVGVKNPLAYSERTGIFSLGPVQDGSVLNSFGVSAGTPTPTTKADGYWLMLNGLPQGDHTLAFGGSMTGSQYSGDLFNHTVVNLHVT